MAPLDAPSPTPSTLPGGLKRPRPSGTGSTGAATTTSNAGTTGTNASSGAGTNGATAARSKRRKAEEGGGGGDDADGTGGGATGAGGRAKQPVNFGVGMVKGREDEWGEPADVITKVSAGFRLYERRGIRRSGTRGKEREWLLSVGVHHSKHQGGNVDQHAWRLRAGDSCVIFADPRSTSTPSLTRRCTSIWRCTICYPDGTPRHGLRNLAPLVSAIPVMPNINPTFTQSKRRADSS